MKYKGFYVKMTPCRDLQREDKNGNIVICEGFNIEVFIDESEETEIDIFSAAVGHEILDSTAEEAEQFVKDYIDSEKKEYKRLVEEYEWQNKGQSVSTTDT